MARETKIQASGRAPYAAPALTIYGSVRDLTGDFSGGTGDMTLMTTGMGMA